MSQLRSSLEARSGDEFKQDKAKSRARGEGGVEEPEVGRRPFLEKASDPADEAVAGEEGQVVKANNGGVNGFGRIPGEEGETDGLKMGERDAIDNVEADGPEESDLFAWSSGARGGDEAHGAADGEN